MASEVFLYDTYNNYIIIRVIYSVIYSGSMKELGKYILFSFVN